jgi:peptidoglycan/xylan/chitin deacetylase (PgdA/CDA1 family)
MFNIKKRIKYFFRPPALILMYHRIASSAIDPWELAVSADNFEQHLQLLKKNYIVEPLPQLVEDLRKKKIKKKSIAISFDDGYTDNYFTAKRLLEKYDLPATFFITSKNIDSKNEFWWDELARILLQTPELPKTLSLEINGQTFFYDLAKETLLTEQLLNRHKKYIACNPETLRSGLYYKLWECFSPMPVGEQLHLIKQIRLWAGVGEASRPEYYCISSHQIKEISASPLFSIGGHTTSHPALPYHEKEIQQEEILNNKIFLENITERKIDLFAYPSGKYNDSTKEIVRQLHFQAAFTTNATVIKQHSDPFALGRFQVNNWNAGQFKQMLLKWSVY